MNMLQTMNTADTLTMSTLEIAELTGKEHRNVLADVRNMFSQLGTDAAEFSATQTYGNNNTREVVRDVNVVMEQLGEDTAKFGRIYFSGA